MKSIFSENPMTSNSKAKKTRRPKNFIGLRVFFALEIDVMGFSPKTDFVCFQNFYMANVARLGGFQTESVSSWGFKLRKKESFVIPLGDHLDHPLGE